MTCGTREAHSYRVPTMSVHGEFKKKMRVLAVKRHHELIPVRRRKCRTNLPSLARSFLTLNQSENAFLLGGSAHVSDIIPTA